MLILYRLLCYSYTSFNDNVSLIGVYYIKHKHFTTFIDVVECHKSFVSKIITRNNWEKDKGTNSIDENDHAYVVYYYDFNCSILFKTCMDPKYHPFPKLVAFRDTIQYTKWMMRLLTISSQVNKRLDDDVVVASFIHIII